MGITSFTITVSGSDNGNGTFTEADFDQAAWGTGGNSRIPTCPSEELGGPTDQRESVGVHQMEDSGDFNVFAVRGTRAPNVELLFFVLGVDEGLGDRMLMTSFTPAFVQSPSPCFWVMSIEMAL